MRTTAGALAALSVLVLAGCAQPDQGGSAAERQPVQKPRVLSVGRGLQAGLPADGGRARPVAAIIGPGRVALATWGSSSCPYTPVRMQARGTDALRMVLDLPGSKHTVCTADLGPTTVRLSLDPAMTSDGTVALLLEFRHQGGDMQVVARPGGGQG
jgi:hypothetical protein